MLNKKTIAVKQDVRSLIIRRISDMTPAELAKVRLAIEKILDSRTLQGFLSHIGHVHKVSLTDGRKTLSVILTDERIRCLGIDLNTVFKGCGGKEVFSREKDVKNGVLVNLDLYQQVALLKAIIEKEPELTQVLGLYNLRGSRKVYEALSRAGILGQLGIWWMWTGERYIKGQDDEEAYPREGIIILANMPTLKGSRFADRGLGTGSWDKNFPSIRNKGGATIFGVQILD